MYILMILVCCCLPLESIAQKTFEPGHIVRYRGDTLYGKIKDRREGASPRLYKAIRFRAKGALFARRYRAGQIKSYTVRGKIYESIGVREAGGFAAYYPLDERRKRFLHLVEKGKLSLYHLEFLNEDGHIDYIPLLYSKKRLDMLRATQGLFGLKKKALAEYLSDCPELIEQIEEKQIQNSRELVDYYNRFCGN